MINNNHVIALKVLCINYHNEKMNDNYKLSLEKMTYYQK